MNKKKENKEERWKTIEGYDNYEVSTQGNIRNIKRGRYLTPAPVTNGYLQVSLYRDGKQKMFLVHRLVAMAFIPNPNGYNELNHKDEDKTNNSVENLEWCTHRENIRYSLARPIIGIRENSILVLASISDCEKLGFSRSVLSKAVKAGREVYNHIWTYINRTMVGYFKQLARQDTHIVVVGYPVKWDD